MPRIRTLAALVALIAGAAACSADSGLSPTEPGLHRAPGTALGGKTAPQEPTNTANDVLSVYILGQNYIPRNTLCGWIAYASGGTQPYTYSWTRTGAGSGTADGMYWDGQIGYGASYMTLTVTVTDASNNQVSTYMNVLADPLTFTC